MYMGVPNNSVLSVWTRKPLVQLFFFIALCLCALIANSAQAKTFKIATVAPDGTTWMNELKLAATEIKKRTDGRVKFRFYPGGVMGNDKSVLRKIRVGQLHGGAITGGGLVDINPDSQVYSLPLAFRSHDEVDYVRKHMDKTIIEGLKQQGFISFGLGEGGFAYLMSDKPVNDINELKSYKVWAPEGDQFSRAAFESIGVSPVQLPLTDVLTGLQTGLIDTIASSAMGAIALQWHSNVKYVTTTPLMYLYGTLVIQRKAFEKLKPEDQKIVEEVMSKTFVALDALNRKDNRQAKAALEKQGIAFTTPSSDEQSQWQHAVKSAVTQLVSKDIISSGITQQLYKHISDFRNGSH
ncbi:TRAP transporter substrate-binding protein DctP [Pseudomonadota bacterium]